MFAVLFYFGGNALRGQVFPEKKSVLAKCGERLYNIIDICSFF